MEQFKGARRFFYNLSAAGYTLLETLFLTFFATIFLPSREMIEAGEMTPFISEKLIWGFIPILGLVMFAGRVVDAIADPLVASFSDKATHPLGRRKIFMAYSCLPLAVSAVLIFFPPVPGISTLNALYLGVIFSLFFACYTMYVAPYMALIPELGHNEKERGKMTSTQALTNLLGAAIVMLGGGPLMALFRDLTGSTLRGYQIMAIVMGILGLGFLLSAVFAVNEKRYSNATPSAVPLKESLKKTMNNKPFLIFLGANMCLWFAFTTVRTSLEPLSTRILGYTPEQLTLPFVNIFGVVILLVALGIIPRLIGKVGKKGAMISGLAAFCLASPFLGLTGLGPVPAKIAGAVILCVIGYGTAIFLVVPNVIIAELCDLDFKDTGEHREGMYFGVHGFFSKLVLGGVTACQTFFFLYFGKDEANPLGIRITLIFCGLIALIGIFLLLRYPEKKIREDLTS